MPRIARIVASGYPYHVTQRVFTTEAQRINYKRQVDVPIVYDGLTFEEGFRLDVLIEDLVICELKAVDNMHPVWEAQILSYLKLSGKRLGFLINFNERYIKDGIKRIIL